MSYNPNIPQPTDIISESQNDLLMNFMKIASSFAANHQPLVGSPSDGKHTNIQMPEQSADPTTPANEGALYAKEDANMQTGLFWRGEDNATPIQLTGSSTTRTGNQYSLNLGVIQLRFGRVTLPGRSNQTTVEFQTPFVTEVYGVVSTGVGQSKLFSNGGTSASLTQCIFTYGDLPNGQVIPNPGYQIFYVAFGQ